jgi:hypothetical protein
MPQKTKPEPDDKEQSERFIQTAKELEADKNAEAFERAFGIVVPPQSSEHEKSDKQSKA